MKNYRWVRKIAMVGICLKLWRSMAIRHLNVQFLCKKNLFPFPLAQAYLLGDVLTNFTPSSRFAYIQDAKIHKDNKVQ